MKDDIDSVRGLLDRLKEEKEQKLRKEVNCSNLCMCYFLVRSPVV